MSISHQNSPRDQKVAENRFWLWQYQSRNSNYRKDYDGFMEKLFKNNLNYTDLKALSGSKSSKFTVKDWAAFRSMIKERKKFLLKYERDPKGYKTGVDSEKILSDIDQDVFEYPLANPEKLLIKTEIISIDWPYLKVQYDLKEDLNLLITELSALYNQYHLINKPGDLSRYKSLLAKVQSFKNEMLLSQTGSKQGRKRIYPRAVGLWLWDRYSFQSKIRGTKEEIYEKYRSHYDNESIPNKYYTKAYDEDRHLDRLLRKTNKCIEKMEVLPMK